jgi:hypothetical protein
MGHSLEPDFSPHLEGGGQGSSRLPVVSRYRVCPLVVPLDDLVPAAGAQTLLIEGL